MEVSYQKKYFLNPIIGIVLFMVLYAISANLYPGGSQKHPNAEGFDWVNNYWCNLLSPMSINGQINPARPVAIAATGIICLSLLLFFFQFSSVYNLPRNVQVLFRTSSIVSMMAAGLIFTPLHDAMTLLSSLSGIVVVVILLRVLYRSGRKIELALGLINVLLMIVNNGIYYTKIGIDHLPWLQKIMFLSVLIWVFWMSVVMYKTTNQSS